MISLMLINSFDHTLNQKIHFCIHSQSDGIINASIMYIKLTLATTDNLLEKQIIKPHPKTTESETVGMEPSNVLTAASEDSDAC